MHHAGEISAWPSVLENSFHFRRLGISRRWFGTGSEFCRSAGIKLAQAGDYGYGIEL